MIKKIIKSQNNTSNKKTIVGYYGDQKYAARKRDKAAF